MAIIVVAALGAGLIAAIAIPTAVLVVIERSLEPDRAYTEGEGLGFLVYFVIGFFAVGPTTVFAVIVAGSRRYNDVGRRALPYVGALCLVLPGIIGSSVLWQYPNNRGMAVLGALAVAALIAALIAWLFTSARRLSLKYAVAGSLVALVLGAGAIVGAELNTERHRYSEHERTLTSMQSALALLSETSPQPTIDGWTIDEVKLLAFAGQPDEHASTEVILRHEAGYEVEVDTRHHTQEQWCVKVGCQFGFSTPLGRRVDVARAGGWHVYDVTFDDAYWHLSTLDEIPQHAMISLIDSLVLVTIDTWLGELDWAPS